MVISPAITIAAISQAGPGPSHENSGAAVNAPIAAAAEPAASARPWADAASSTGAASATAAWVPGDWMASPMPCGTAMSITRGTRPTNPYAAINGTVAAAARTEVIRGP